MRVGAILLLVEIFAASPALAQTFADGRAAYMRNRVGEAERTYKAVAADASHPAADRSSAERELARIAWLIDGDAKRALAHLATARAIGDKPCDTSAMIARVLRESQHYEQAASQKDGLLQACPEADRQDVIRRHLVGAFLDRAASNPQDRAKLFSDAAAEAMNLGPDSGVEGARVRLETAIMTGNAAAALAAWKDFFWLEDSDAPQGLADSGATGIFTRGLAPQGRADDRLKLAELLMRSGFSDQSRRFSALHDLEPQVASDPAWKRLQAYWRMRDTIDPLMLRVNRGLARGKRDEKAIETAAKKATTELMTAAGATGDPAPALLEHYGLVATVGETSGYPSMHAGHMIEDRSDTISQYGQTAQIHFMSIDNMIANGFESWLWDGGPMVGGWNSGKLIVQVRPGYVSSPLRMEALRRDGPARRELIEQQSRRAAEDIAKLKARPVATLEGLSDRLTLQYADQIEAAVRAKGTPEAELKRAFLAEYVRAVYDQSIRVHEGRHAIDGVLGHSGKVEQPVLEYNAKLSELALTAYPRIALDNMSHNLEGEGPHDKAGARVFADYRRWMEANTDQIMGYDPGVPLLAQLDKLTDNQIREIARGLDRLARGDKTAPLKL